MARAWILVGLLLLPAVAGAQTRAHRRGPGPLAAAATQGSGDEILLPITEIRLRRSARGTRTRRPCLRPPVEVRRLRGRNPPRWTGPLTDCAGRPTVQAMAALALLARTDRSFTDLDLVPALVELRRRAPSAGLVLADEAAPPRRIPGRDRTPPLVVERDAHTHDPVIDLAPTARVLHPRLVQMLQQVVDRFPGHAIEIISGFRQDDSLRATSRHAHARALDFRLEGVGHEALRDFVRTLPDAGVGYYPNSVFVHMDVRDPDEGSAFWTDYSGPGERPRYGRWPPTDQDITREVDYLVNRAENELEAARGRETPAPRPPAR